MLSSNSFFEAVLLFGKGFPPQVRQVVHGDDLAFQIQEPLIGVQLLEAVCGKPVKYLSYPYGIYSQATDILLKQKYNGLITFCSREEKETLPCGFVAPLGRFNRSLSFQFK